MLTRSLVTSVLPRSERRSRLMPSGWRQLAGRLSTVRSRSLRIQNRADAVRARCEQRHAYGRRDA